MIATFHSSPDGHILLPSPNSYWYAVSNSSLTFRAKKVALISGSISADAAPEDTVGSINLTPTDGPQLRKWQVSFTVVNQQKLSVTLTQAQLEIVLTDGTTLLLQDLDAKSLDYILSQQEAFPAAIIAAIAKDSAAQGLMKRYAAAIGLEQQLSPTLQVGWLPEITTYDGPKIRGGKPTNVQSVWLSGSRKGNMQLVTWLRIMVAPQLKLEICVALRTLEGDTIDACTIELAQNTPLFWLENWTTHNEFKLYWQMYMGNAPIPKVLPPDAGIVVRQSPIQFEWLSDLLIPSPTPGSIIVRSSYFAESPVGQFVIGFIGEAI